MPEDHAQKDLGHLDIDAVSAYVDRDFEPADLAMIAIHLAHCPACDREVLEIRTTVLLLAGLPQYEPRRSFCLGQEHARASRRRDHVRQEQPWPAASPLTDQPGSPLSLPASERTGGWVSGLHVAALVVGALLLLVTAGDLTGIVSNTSSPLQLAAPTAAAGITTLTEAPLPAPEAPQSAPAEVPPAADLASEPASSNFSAAFQDADGETGGTEERERASEGVLESEELAQSAPRSMATVAGVAAVTQAIPTPGASDAPAGAVPGETTVAADRAVGDGQPSLLRIVQLVLVVVLAWLVVTIAGFRWVRRLR